MPTTATADEPSRCADRAEVDAGDRDDLRQHQFLLSASTMRSRPACQAGSAPGGKPERDHEHDADDQIAGVGK